MGILMNICLVENCDKKAILKGVCELHYKKLYNQSPIVKTNMKNKTKRILPLGILE